MDILIGILSATGVIVGIIFLRIITMSLHVIGHAIPALILTKGMVSIHIGIEKNQNKSFHFSIGRLKTFFSWKIFDWKIGFYKNQKSDSFTKNLLITLGGPIMSLFLGIFFLILILKNAWSDEIIWGSSFIIFLFLFDFFSEIIPINSPIKLSDGSDILNDGMILKNLFLEKKYPPEYSNALDFIEKKQYTHAAENLKKLLDLGFEKKEFQLKYLHTLIQSDQLELAEKKIEELKEQNKFKTSDFVLLAQFHFAKSNYQKVIDILNEYLFKNFQDADALNDRGKAFLKIAEYQKAIHDFNSAIIYDEEFAEAFCFRGLAKIRLGDLEDGLDDIEKSKSLDDSNPFIYLHFGYYFLEKNDKTLALENFIKAKKMKINFHGIDYLIETSTEHNFD